ncbi:hypothetical protein NL676_035650 [Syzygium grande]|nr:hypothetical protein NL676_035650 [Syzygium grande]
MLFFLPLPLLLEQITLAGFSPNRQPLCARSSPPLVAPRPLLASFSQSSVVPSFPTRVFKLGCEPNFFVTNTLIHLYSAFKKPQSACLVFDVVSVLDSFCCIAKCYVMNSEVDSARELFDEMTERDALRPL